MAETLLMKLSHADLPASQVLKLASEDVDRVLAGAQEAVEEFQRGELEGNDGLWAKRYHRRLVREIDALMRLLGQVRMAAGFGEMDMKSVNSFFEKGENALGMLRKACALADQWMRRIPVEAMPDLPDASVSLPELMAELHEMCLDNAALMKRLDNVRKGTEEISVVHLDEIEEDQEDGLELSQALKRKALQWRVAGEVAKDALARLERGIGVFEDGCRILIKCVEDARPYSSEAVLEVLVKDLEAAHFGNLPTTH